MKGRRVKSQYMIQEPQCTCPSNGEQLSKFEIIEPKEVKVADKTIFMVTGVGHMKIDIPNRRDSTTVTLKDMLYHPDLGYTLISLAECDTASFTVTLKDKSCCINDTKGLQVG